MDLQITTSRNAPSTAPARVAELARQWGFDLRPRRDVDWSQPVVMLTRTGLVVRVGDRELRWHRGLMHARRNAGANFPVVKLGALKPGDTVVDLTCGLGLDAWFLSEWTQQTVVSFESTPLLGLMAAEGLRASKANVSVRIEDALTGLRSLPTASVEVVYADPMFERRPLEVGGSTTLDLVRLLADDRAPTLELIAEARRVASRCVVMKDLHPGERLESLGAEYIHVVRKKRVRYGRWTADSAAGSAQQ